MPIPASGIQRVPFQEQVDIATHQPNWLQIGSFAELEAKEKPILDRIAKTRNAGHLFLLHPFLLLHDIGVEASPKVWEEIVKASGLPAKFSEAAYHRLKVTATPQRVHVHLKGLFKRSVR